MGIPYIRKSTNGTFRTYAKAQMGPGILFFFFAQKRAYMGMLCKDAGMPASFWGYRGWSDVSCGKQLEQHTATLAACARNYIIK